MELFCYVTKNSLHSPSKCKPHVLICIRHIVNSKYNMMHVLSAHVETIIVIYKALMTGMNDIKSKYSPMLTMHHALRISQYNAGPVKRLAL